MANYFAVVIVHFCCCSFTCSCYCLPYQACLSPAIMWFGWSCQRFSSCLCLLPFYLPSLRSSPSSCSTSAETFFGPAHVQHLRAAARGAAGSLSAHLERRQRARLVCVWVRFLCACACVFVCLVCVSVFTRLTSLSFLLIFILPKNACARTSSRNRPSYGVRTLGRSSCCCLKQEANGGTSKASHRRARDTLRRRKDYTLATEVCILPSYYQTNK